MGVGEVGRGRVRVSKGFCSEVRSESGGERATAKLRYQEKQKKNR